jgi:plastocyanin
LSRTRTTRLLALALGVLLVAALAGCGGAKTPAATTGGATGGASTPAAAPVTIVMKDFAFTPDSATVKIGDAVTFENQDSADHRVSIDGQDLGQQTTGQKVEWKATKAGTFPFSCTIHPAMTGQITVE